MAELQDPRAVAGQVKVAPQLPGSPPAHRGTCGFLTNLLSRAASFVVFAVLLAAFPSQAPEFVNQSLLTRSWELLHLLLVGIAVSYGLFSRRNAVDATDKEPPIHRAEDATPRSYVSQLLQVPSVFDEDDDDDDETARSGTDGSKLQVWNSHYSRVPPAVVIADGGNVDGGSGAGRPLLLPVRSLRSRVPEEESSGGKASRAPPKSRVENGGLRRAPSLDSPPPREIPSGGGGALPSPIPWRTRSGRMEFREEAVATASPSCSLPPPATDADMSPLMSPSSRRSPSSQSNSAAASSPRKLSPSPSVSPELRAKAGEDVGRKKTIYKPPPPPPPPPPPFIHRTPHFPSFKDPKRSFKDELKEFDSKPRNPVEVCSPGSSVRTVQPTKKAVQVVTAGRSSSSSSSPATVAASSPSPAYEYKDVEEAESARKTNKDSLEEAVVVETDDDEGTDSDEASEDVGDLPAPAPAPARARAEENEVDKKADEFIAKFREQIRLQRIESIRRSAGQRTGRRSTKGEGSRRSCCCAPRRGALAKVAFCRRAAGRGPSSAAVSPPPGLAALRRVLIAGPRRNITGFGRSLAIPAVQFLPALGFLCVP